MVTYSCSGSLWNQWARFRKQRRSNSAVVRVPLTPAAWVRAPLWERLVEIYFSPFNSAGRVSLSLSWLAWPCKMAVPSHWLWVGHKRTTEDDKLPGSGHPQGTDTSRHIYSPQGFCRSYEKESNQGLLHSVIKWLVCFQLMQWSL